MCFCFTPVRVHVISVAAESDGDSSEWPMEQEETMEGLLCDTPALLPTLSLSLTSNEVSQAPESPAVAPASTSAQTTVSDNQGKGIKVGDEGDVIKKGCLWCVCLDSSCACLSVCVYR